MLSYKIKTNEAWADETPVEFWLKTDKELVKKSKSKLVALRERLDELLRWADVPRNARTRKELFISINRAAAAAASLELKALPPKDLVEKLKTKIEDISDLLAELKHYRGMIEISNPTYRVGAGVVEVLPLEVFKTFKAVQALPVSGTALISMQNLLEAWHESVKRLLRTEPKRPENDLITEIVRYAIDFFLRHSAKTPSSFSNNPILLFTQQFYESVTGLEPKSSLAWFIRKVLKETPGSTPRKKVRDAAGGKSPKKADLPRSRTR